MNRIQLASATVLLLLAGTAGCTPCACPAVAAPGPAVSVSPPAPGAAAAAPVTLLNADAAGRRMRTVYPPHLYDAGRRGDVVVEVTLDAEGGVEAAADVEANNDQFRGPALTVAQELRFSAPPAPGTTVRVRMRFQPAGSRVEIVP